jgi:membrane-associated protease RseP (regulator of RpoE activity)
VYLLAVLNDDLLATYADLWIWPAAPGPARPDRVRVQLDSGADVATLAGGFQTSTFLSGTWLGAQLVDVGDTVTVASVSAGGPAEAGGLLVGDRVVSIAGTNLTGASAARRQIASTEPGTAVAIQVQRGAATQVAEVTLGASPQVISPSDPELVYSVISVSLAAEANDAAAAEPQWVVRLNQAAVLIHAGAWEEVVRVLRSIEDAPSGAGVGQATVDYWLGIALTALGPTYRDAAAQSFERAAADPQARLFSNDGPWVAPRAAARLAELGAR